MRSEWHYHYQTDVIRSSNPLGCLQCDPRFVPGHAGSSPITEATEATERKLVGDC